MDTPTIKTPLCKCNNCGHIYVDTNPQVDAKLYEVPVVTPTLKLVNVEGDSVNACPDCKTDDYLSDL